MGKSSRERQLAGLRPAGPGNELARTHGAKVSELRLIRDERTVEVAAQVRLALPSYSIADEAMIQAFAIVCVRVERAAAAIARIDEVTADEPLAAYNTASTREMLATLRHDLGQWIGRAQRLAESLGLTPTARAKLGLSLLESEARLRDLQEQGAEVRKRAERRLEAVE